MRLTATSIIDTLINAISIAAATVTAASLGGTPPAGSAVSAAERYTLPIGRWVCVGLLVGALLGCHLTNVSLAEDAASPAAGPSSRLADDDIVAFINQRIQMGWEDNDVQPSAVADDSEWMRRVYLDLTGRIPTSTEVRAFLKDKNPTKRTELVDRLLASREFVMRMTTVWANHLLGRRTPQRTSRPALEKFLREAFTRQRPWNDVVRELVTAEGHYEENGAVNYLLAQMEDRDMGVQATAATARLFLGLQVQCTQCHDHPFNDWKQAQFWEFNSFFRQARRIDHRKIDPNSGREVDDYSELARSRYEGPVYFEKRSGLMQVAFPNYNGTAVDPSNSVDRRMEFGEFLQADADGQLARAMVNRTWAQLFGYGFTRPVDDMGPHNPPSHPELLERLAAEFKARNYDLRQLVRWICLSDAYHLTSQIGKQNAIDDPSAGELPLFSHMYVKAMEAEQVYDSLLQAATTQDLAAGNYEDSLQQRQRWLQQFVVAFDTDEENPEATNFNGSIPQALMMMNGELVRNAVTCEPGTRLHQIVMSDQNDNMKIQELFLTALSRMPNRSELSAAQQLLKTGAAPVAYADLLWALLNSNEFSFVH